MRQRKRKTQNYLQLTEVRALLINFPGPGSLSCSRKQETLQQQFGFVTIEHYLKAKYG